MLIGYTMALYLAVGSRRTQSFATFIRSVRDVMSLGLLGETPVALKETNTDNWANPALVTAIIIAYIIVTVILLLNLVIAMMGNTYSNVAAASLKRWYVERANIMLSYEAEFTQEQMLENRRGYGVKLDYENTMNSSPSESLYLKVTVYDPEWKIQSYSQVRLRTSLVTLPRSQSGFLRFATDEFARSLTTPPLLDGIAP